MARFVTIRPTISTMTPFHPAWLSGRRLSNMIASFGKRDESATILIGELQDMPSLLIYDQLGTAVLDNYSV